MLTPTLEEAQKLSEYGVIPIKREIFADIKTPIEVLKILRGVSRHVYILESVEDREKWGRYTFLGYNPALEISTLDGELTVKNIQTGEVTRQNTAHPANYISDLMREYTSPKLKGFPSFTGGLVGYFGYDYIKYNEPRL